MTSVPDRERTIGCVSVSSTGGSPPSLDGNTSVGTVVFTERDDCDSGFETSVPALASEESPACSALLSALSAPFFDVSVPDPGFEAAAEALLPIDPSSKLTPGTLAAHPSPNDPVGLEFSVSLLSFARAASSRSSPEKEN